MGLSAKRPNGISGGFSKPVCTLLYQSPEQLFRSSKGYNEKADIWGVGCIFYELLAGNPLFYAAKSQDQLIDLILQRFGEEEFGSWEEGKQTEVFKSHLHRLRKQKTIFQGLKSLVSDENALSLLDLMCSVNPDKRPTASECLKHLFLKDEVDVEPVKFGQ